MPVHRTPLRVKRNVQLRVHTNLTTKLASGAVRSKVAATHATKHRVRDLLQPSSSSASTTSSKPPSYRTNPSAHSSKPPSYHSSTRTTLARELELASSRQAGTYLPSQSEVNYIGRLVTLPDSPVGVLPARERRVGPTVDELPVYTKHGAAPERRCRTMESGHDSGLELDSHPILWAPQYIPHVTLAAAKCAYDASLIKPLNCRSIEYSHIVRILYPSCGREARKRSADPEFKHKLQPGMVWPFCEGEVWVLNVVIPEEERPEDREEEGKGKIPYPHHLLSKSEVSRISSATKDKTSSCDRRQRTNMTPNQLKAIRDFLSLALPFEKEEAQEGNLTDLVHVLITVPALSTGKFTSGTIDTSASSSRSRSTTSSSSSSSSCNIRLSAPAATDALSALTCSLAYIYKMRSKQVFPMLVDEMQIPPGVEGRVWKDCVGRNAFGVLDKVAMVD